MCGICGIVGCNVEDNLIKAMLESIAHRGPDDEGIFHNKNIFLGHRRLSVLDTSQLGHQPMEYKDYVIVFNGEIFNYIELRKQLIEKKHNFITGTDTEVVLHGYVEWGKKVFSHMRGMWALSILDKKNSKIIFSRDRFGIKPFYYHYEDNVFRFASEIPSLFKAGVKRSPNYDVIFRYLIAGIDDNGKDTFFQDIHQLPGGCNIEYNLLTGNIEHYRYYDLMAELQMKDVRNYEDVFDETISIHLRSDVLIGSCLSGGLDSSSLAGIIQRKINSNGQKLIAVTAKSELLENDESEIAKQVAVYSGMDWKMVCPTYDDFVCKHLDMLRQQAEPVGSPSVFMQYCVMEKASKCGIKVMFDGQGGDETLLGYERYYVSYLFSLIRKGKLLETIKSYREICQNSKLSLVSLAKYILYFGYKPIRKLILNKRFYFVKNNYKKQFFSQSKDYLCQSMDMMGLHYEEITKKQLPHLLRYEDRNSMRFSIEARCPYVDHIYVQNAIALPFETKVHEGWTKFCLRKLAEKVIPKEIAWRKNKFGFEAPEKKWLEMYLPVMQKVVNQSSILQDITTKIPDLSKLSLRLRWRLYNLAIWEKQYVHHINLS